MAGSVRDLKVWQESVALAGDTIRAVRAGMKRETRVVGEQIMLTALAVAQHVADGYSRYTTLEQRHLYRAARRDLTRLETQLAVARQAELLSAPHFAELATRAQGVHRLLSGYLVYLERQVAGTDAG